MVPVLLRGAFCPKDREQHRLLVQMESELKVAYTKIVRTSRSDFGAMSAELFGRRPAGARGGPGNQGADALQVSLLIHLLSSRWRSCVRFWLSTSTMDGAGPGAV